jgi:hypothetical protein
MEQLHSNTKSEQYRSGFLECITETVQFIGHHQADHHGPFYPGDDFGSRLVAHLHNHYEKIGRGMFVFISLYSCAISFAIPIFGNLQKKKKKEYSYLEHNPLSSPGSNLFIIKLIILSRKTKKNCGLRKVN